MTNPFVPRVGGILSADIAVPEHARELRFYARALTTGESPLWRDDLMNNVGQPIIGLGARSEEYENLPLQWMPHIQVADVAASAKRALDLGGKALMLDDKSRWAVLLDPNGAAFGIVPVVSAEAVPPADGVAAHVGHISWLDLTVADASASRDFYQQVVGWSVQDIRMEDSRGRYGDYSMVGGDGNKAAGIRHARGANVGLPPVWMICLPVGDLAESIRRVREEGGRIVSETRANDGAYSRAVVQDPVGAYISLVSG